MTEKLLNTTLNLYGLIESLNTDGYFSETTGGRAIEKCIEEELAELRRRLADLREAHGGFEVTDLHDDYWRTIDSHFQELESSDIGKRIYRYIWILRPEEAIFPSDGSWKEYYRRSKEVVKAGKLDGVRALLVLDRPAGDDIRARQANDELERMARCIAKDIKGLRGYECRVMELSRYTTTVGQMKWLRFGDQICEDFGMFGDRLLFRGKHYFSDGKARQVPDVRGVFTAGPLVQRSIQDFDDQFWRRSDSIALTGDTWDADIEDVDEKRNRSRAEADDARQFVERLATLDLSSPEYRAEALEAKAHLTKLNDSLEKSIRKHMCRELERVWPHDWVKRLESLLESSTKDRIRLIGRLRGEDLAGKLQFLEYKGVIERAARDHPSAFSHLLCDLTEFGRQWEAWNIRSFAHAKEITTTGFLRAVHAYRWIRAKLQQVGHWED